MAATVNPYLGTEAEDGWAMGFTWGFIGPAFSQEPPLVIAPEQVDVFNEGVLAGQQAAIDGLPLISPCVSLEVEVSPAAESFMTGVHAFEVLGLLRALGHFAHFTCEGLVGAFLLLIPGPPPLSADAEFASIAASARDRLIELGLAQHSLFLACGIDEEAAGCELQFTPIFTEVDSPRTAVKAQGRPHWVIAKWNADAPMSGGGFEVIESSSE